MSDLEKEGLIQRFEYSYELAWKTMKDYLEEHGTNINPVTPRNVIKEAFSANIITDGQVWVDMLLHRNLLSHTYDFSKFQEVLDAVVKRYLAVQEQVARMVSDETNGAVSGLDAEELSQLQALFSCYPKIR